MDNKKEYNAYPPWLLPEKPVKLFSGWMARDLTDDNLCLLYSIHRKTIPFNR